MRPIIFITSVYDNTKTGPATFARLLHKHFIKDGMEFKIVTCDFATQDPDIINVKTTFPKSLVYYRIWRRAKQLVKSYPKGDIIVHYNNSFAYLNFGKLGGRSIVQVNDYYNASMTIRNKSGLKWNVWIRHLLRKIPEANSLRKADRIICNSRYTMDVICNTYRIAPEKCTVIYKSVDSELLQYKSDNTTTGRILFVGNSYYLKGLDILIDALPFLSYTKELYIVGPAKLDHHLLEKLNDNKQGISITISGGLQQQELYRLMTASDILVIPARYEALGVTVVEAAAQGVPVITSGAGGLREVLEQHDPICSDSQNLNPVTLATHINKMHEHYSHYKLLADNMAYAIREKFDVNTMIARIYKEYESAQ